MKIDCEDAKIDSEDEQKIVLNAEKQKLFIKHLKTLTEGEDIEDDKKLLQTLHRKGTFTTDYQRALKKFLRDESGDLE